jgi:hypothetical protein
MHARTHARTCSPNGFLNQQQHPHRLCDPMPLRKRRRSVGGAFAPKYKCAAYKGELLKTQAAVNEAHALRGRLQANELTHELETHRLTIQNTRLTNDNNKLNTTIEQLTLDHEKTIKENERLKKENRKFTKIEDLKIQLKLLTEQNDQLALKLAATQVELTEMKKASKQASKQARNSSDTVLELRREKALSQTAISCLEVIDLTHARDRAKHSYSLFFAPFCYAHARTHMHTQTHTGKNDRVVRFYGKEGRAAALAEDGEQAEASQLRAVQDREGTCCREEGGHTSCFEEGRGHTSEAPTARS